MIRRIVVGLLGVTFLLAGLAIAQAPPAGDDPPVRLKKKHRPDAAEPPQEEPQPPAEQPKEKDPKAKEPKEGEEPDQPDKPEMDEAEVLNRVGKNMRTAEDRIDRAELNDATRQVQEDILKDLDSLINQEKNGGGGGGDEQNQQNQDDKQNQQNKQNQAGQKQQDSGQVKLGMGKRKGGLKGSRQHQQARRGQGQKQGSGQGEQMAKAGGAKPNHQGGGGQQGQKPNQKHGNMGGGGGKSEGPPSKLAEMYKDEWGHLPETMRAQMNAYSREQFMAKYNDLIKQYYSTVAEKSRKKD